MEREVLEITLPSGVFDYVKFIKDYPEVRIMNNEESSPTAIFTNVLLPNRPSGPYNIFTKESLIQSINCYKVFYPEITAALLEVIKTRPEVIDADLINNEWATYHKETRELYVKYTNILRQ